MKNTLKKLGSVLVMLFAVAALTLAQDAGGDKPDIKEKFRNNLTEDQKALIEANKEATKERREAFKASLSEEQKAILENKQLTKKERMEVFKASLTDAQKELLAANREAMKAQKDAFRATLTDEQKAAMKQRARKHRWKKHNKGQQEAGVGSGAGQGGKK